MTAWQEIPAHLSPIIVTIGPFALRWYAVLWIAAVATAALVVRHCCLPAIAQRTGDIVFAAFLGAVLGGRLGYALFYDPSLLVQPVQLIWPLDASGAWVGLRGMSFHGGAIGVAIALAVAARILRLPLWRMGDCAALAAPLALALGRLGNFLNGELWGRVTTVPWGMAFPMAPDGGTLLRHPSQLYEAGSEGLALFLLLLAVRRRTTTPGVVAATFVIGYAMVRFAVEYVRAPDLHLGFGLWGLTRGQWLSLAMLAIGLALLWWRRSVCYTAKDGHVQKHTADCQ